MAQMRRVGVAVILGLLGLLLIPIGGASAHARPKSSDPADKAVLATAPAQVTIIFTEETSPTKSDGSVIDVQNAVVSTGFKVDLNDRAKMTIALKPNLPNGAYTVKWHTLTEDDNGSADGTLSFTVQGAAQQAATPAPTTPPTAAPTSAATITPTRPAASATTPSGSATGTPFTGVRVDVTPTVPPVVTTQSGAIATATAPATLPTTGQPQERAMTPWVLVLLVLGAIALAGGILVSRLRARH